MWDLLAKHFSSYPAQSRVAQLLLDHGFAVRGDDVCAGPVSLTDTAIARAADVDRRVVRSTVETVQDNSELAEVFAKLEPTSHLRNVAPELGWGVLEIVPSDASQSGILAGVTQIIADHGISVRQAIVDDPEMIEKPRLFIVTEGSIPSRILPEIQEVPGVREVVIGSKAD
jgi:predicted regulator of amino acid metabolism with ACT domain